MRSSWRTTFAGIWLVLVATCVALAFLLDGLYRLGVDARVDSVAARVDKAANALRGRFASYARSYAAPPDFTDAQRRRELGLMLQIVLQDFDDVEGGFYSSQAGFVAYAFPSYEGSGTKQDVPEAESARIAAVAERAAVAGRSAMERVPGARQTLVLEALPIDVSGQPMSVWAMSRAHARADDASRRLLVGLALLGTFIVASGLALSWSLRRWNGALRALGQDLERAPGAAAWTVAPTGHRDLDRVAEMVAALHRRLDDERGTALRLQAELARAQRVATVGRMTAQLVHEIRNPIGAMRLRAENALAGAGEPAAALASVLADVRRLEDLLERMQAMTRLNVLRIEPVPLDHWIAERVAAARGTAATRGVTIAHTAPATAWPIDPVQLGGALDNLLSNAVRHAPESHGRVDVRVTIASDVARIEVEDDGPGLADDALERVFEPFHTTRVDGTGLGLSIAREIVEAHGGTLRAVARSRLPAGGARFLIELPWRAS